MEKFIVLILFSIVSCSEKKPQVLEIYEDLRLEYYISIQNKSNESSFLVSNKSKDSLSFNIYKNGNLDSQVDIGLIGYDIDFNSIVETNLQIDGLCEFVDKGDYKVSFYIVQGRDHLYINRYVNNFQEISIDFERIIHIFRENELIDNFLNDEFK